MTNEQLNALENWIESIIEDKDRASGLHESIRRDALKNDVLIAFGLRESE